MIRTTLTTACLIAIVATPAIAGYADLVLADPGLVSYWRFEEEISAGGEAIDSNKNANPGTYATGISAEPAGVVGQAAFFDGEDGSVITIINEEPFNFEESMSVEAWFRTGEFTRGWQSVIGKGDDQWRLHRGCTNGCTELKFGTEDGSRPADTPDTGVELDDDLWHHIVAVFDGNDDLEGPDGASKYIYLDGELLVEQPISGVIRSADAADPPHLPVMIGGNSEYPGEGFRSWNGWLDEVAVYDRALSEADVASHFTADRTDAPTGDFNGDGMLDAADLDLLSAAIRDMQSPAGYDVDGNQAVDDLDRKYWVGTLKNTWTGDANLDGEFNSGDFVAVFTAGEYEDAIDNNSGWAEGDWDGNGDFNSGDFVAAFTDGGYETGPRVATAAVPEPTSLIGIPLAALLMLRSRKRRTR